LTICADVECVVVAGVSMLNGLELERAVGETRLLRLLSILMTALVAAVGFVPMALNSGVGAEVQRPLATVVIGAVSVHSMLERVAMGRIDAPTSGRTTAAAPPPGAWITRTDLPRPGAAPKIGLPVGRSRAWTDPPPGIRGSCR
jgi:hypothetical protein